MSRGLTRSKNVAKLKNSPLLLAPSQNETKTEDKCSHDTNDAASPTQILVKDSVSGGVKKTPPKVAPKPRLVIEFMLASIIKTIDYNEYIF